MGTTKKYIFIFEDKNQNQLEKRTAECSSLKEAKEIAKKYKANSNLNDLHKIIVRKKEFWD